MAIGDCVGNREYEEHRRSCGRTRSEDDPRERCGLAIADPGQRLSKNGDVGDAARRRSVMLLQKNIDFAVSDEEEADK
ncbi:hypothetical protein FHT44_006282 [Mycolicibacterium sp. BK634]|nr:hypothetical protein [Mycolicibacterium sp. BK634]